MFYRQFYLINLWSWKDFLSFKSNYENTNFKILKEYQKKDTHLIWYDSIRIRILFFLIKFWQFLFSSIDYRNVDLFKLKIKIFKTLKFCFIYYGSFSNFSLKTKKKSLITIEYISNSALIRTQWFLWVKLLIKWKWIF